MKRTFASSLCLTGLLANFAASSFAFSTPAIKDFQSSPSPAKQLMAKGFVEHHLLIGKTREQISELLGTPESYPDPAVCAVFALSNEKIEKWPTRSLDLSFDNDGRVRCCRIAERFEQPSDGVFGQWRTKYSRRSEKEFLTLKLRQQIKFNSVIWVGTQKTDRLEMVRDLLTNEKILGKSRADVRTLLGAPEYEITQDEDSYRLDRSAGTCGNAGSLRLDILYSNSAVSAFRIASHFWQPTVGTKGNWIY